MGRSRGVFHSADEDPTQRSRRKKNSSTGENSESAAAGQGTSEGKRALYHCNYCNKDITGRIRIKCAVCPDFDLCVECHSVGAELKPHKSNHPYRVMDILSFPLFCPDWSADEEILLLEGIEMYGIGNWAEVAEHVGTKSKEQCIEHYNAIYMNSSCFPLPDMSHVVGKNRKELLAMAQGNGEDKKGFSLLGELALKEDSPFSPSRVKIEDPQKGSPVGRLLSNINAEVDCGVRSSSTNAAGVKKASNMVRVKDGPSGIKIEEPQIDRSFGGKKPSSLGNKGPLFELSGYNVKRQEFEHEYDNDAEQLLAEMEFKDTDTEDERELKLRVLRIYSKRLDERKRRKDFILERNLLHPNPYGIDLSPEETELCRHYDPFMRFHLKEEHLDFLQSVVSEYRLLKRLEELKEARAAGCRTSAEADRYLAQKSKRAAAESAQIDTTSAPFSNSSSDTGSPVADLLSETEKQLCRELRLPPNIYQKMREVMSIEIISGNITRKADAHRFFRMEPGKVDRVYDLLVKKGIAPP